MANMNVPSPHFAQHPNCLRCGDGALKYNHCAWCGSDHSSHAALREHWRNSACGKAMVNWLRDVA